MHLDHRTQRNSSADDLEASSLLAVFHSAAKNTVPAAGGETLKSLTQLEPCEIQ